MPLPLSAPLRRALLLALLLALLPSAAVAQAPEPDLPAYAAWVREALAAARRGDQIALTDGGGRLAAVRQVRLPDGSFLPVDNAWLAEALAEQSPDTARIAERLGALADALAQPPAGWSPAALERLRDLLSRPPYAAAPPPGWLDWLGEALGWLARALEALLRPLGGAAAPSSPIAWPITALGALMLVGVVAYLLAGVRRGVVREARAAEGAEEQISSREAIDQAGALAQAGDHRSAVRMLYLAALLRLDERGLLRYDRSLTNREYLERARENLALRGALAPIVETFDRVWYGHAPLEPEAFDEYRRRVERLGRET